MLNCRSRKADTTKVEAYKMKYQCVDPKCKAIFSHPAKHMTRPTNFKEYKNKMESGETFVYEEFETYVCPICNGKFFTEYDEPKPEISSVVSVDLAQVDSYLAKGYVVHELYAKTATLKMLKVAPKDAEPKSEGCVNPHEKIYRGCSVQCEEFKTCQNPDAVKAKAEAKV